MRLLRSTVDQLSPLRARMEALEGQLKEADVVATSLKVRGQGWNRYEGEDIHVPLIPTRFICGQLIMFLKLVLASCEQNASQSSNFVCDLKVLA